MLNSIFLCFSVLIAGSGAYAATCELSFSHSIDPATPSHLLLIGENAEKSIPLVVPPSRFKDPTHNVYLKSTPDDFARALATGARDADPGAVDPRQNLEDRLMYEAAAEAGVDAYLSRFGRLEASRLLRSVSADVTRATMIYLESQGTNLDYAHDHRGGLRAEILPDGEGRYNRRADQIRRDYLGTKLFVGNSKLGRALFHSIEYYIELSPLEILANDPKSSTIGHELRHAWADIYGDRDFGDMASHESQPVPGSPHWYEKGQSFDEAETHSYSLRQSAQKLLARYLRPDLAKSGVEEYGRTLAHYALVSGIVAERNDILVKTLERTLRGSWQWAVYLPNENHKFPNRRFINMLLQDEEGQRFVYELYVHDQTLTTYDEVKVYLRAKARQMARLADNYRAQFTTARRVVTKLSNLKTAREKATVLSGLIAITRPHFWEEDRFVDVTEADLVQRFNVVVSDRWQRYAYLDSRPAGMALVHK